MFILQGPEHHVYAELPPEYPFLETKLPASMAHYKSWANSGYLRIHSCYLIRLVSCSFGLSNLHDAVALAAAGISSAVPQAAQEAAPGLRACTWWRRMMLLPHLHQLLQIEETDGAP